MEGKKVLAAIVLAVLLGGQGCRRASTPATPADPLRPNGPSPNIIMIMIDTLRADRLGSYCHEGGLCPTLDAIAAEGVIFDRVIAPSPWTQPSMASLFTSLYPAAHKVDLNLYGMPLARQAHPFLPTLNCVHQTLPELLQKNNYLTAGFIANPLLRERYGFGQGFNHYDVSFAADDTPGTVVNQAAEEWLRDRDPGKPFFLYLHYMDVHSPSDSHSRPDAAALPGSWRTRRIR
jgi:arylsulfatase A-like enzyme